MNYIFVILSLSIFIGCSSNDVKPVAENLTKIILVKSDDNITCNDLADILPIKTVEISDLVNIPQDASYYTKVIDNNVSMYDIQKKYEQYYFSMWNIDQPKEDIKSIKWPFSSYCAGKSYGENFQLLEKNFFDKMLESANFDLFATVNKKAITLKEVNIRAFPTIKPLLKNPSLAGEGFPFDYLQNSTMHANEPIFISHYSKDGEWAYIFSSYASGWVRADEFVILNKEQTDIWQKAQQVNIIKEDEAIYSIDGNFLFKSKIGMMFALVTEDENTYTILAVSSYKNSEPLFVKSKIPKTIANKGAMTLSGNNLETVINEVSKTNYGWGGMYEQRDCSSMLRDMFAPFGIWLPRNSYQQSKTGKIIKLENLSDQEKTDLIKEQGIPFQTFLHKKGHIVLYVGTHDNEVIVFHNTWGIKTKKDGVEGRIVIGKPIFSTLRLGQMQEYYDKESEILKNLTSMNILTK